MQARLTPVGNASSAEDQVIADAELHELCQVEAA